MTTEQTHRVLARAAGSILRNVTDDAAHDSHAIVAGAVGRMGEAVLNAVLARGGYRRVSVVTERSVELNYPKLQTQTWSQLQPARDLFVVTAGHGETAARSFHGRDAPFTEVDAANPVQLVDAVRRLGVKRVVLLSPAPMWEQFGHTHRGLSSPVELALGGIDLHRLVVLRPLRAATSSSGSLMQRFVRVYLSVQLLMMPRSVPAHTSEQVARAALAALALDRDGVWVMSAGEIGQLLARDFVPG